MSTRPLRPRRLRGARTLPDVRVPDRLRPSPALVAGVAALAVAAIVGWWLGGVSTRAGSRRGRRTRSPRSATCELEIEAGWAAAEAAPGPLVEGGQAFAPLPGLSARALLVTGPAVDATLVPAALRAELPETLPSPRRAMLGGLTAWHYGPLRTKNRILEVTVAPTTAGMLALTCSAPPASWSAALGCAEGVHAITSAKAKALDPTDDLAFRQAAGPALAALDRERVAGRRTLARAGKPAPRAAAATALAGVHRDAAAALAPFAVEGEHDRAGRGAARLRPQLRLLRGRRPAQQAPAVHRRPRRGRARRGRARRRAARRALDRPG